MEIAVNTSHPYQILIERGCLGKIGDRAAELFRPKSRAVIVSDSNVAPRYAQGVSDALKAAGFEPTVFVFPAGEESKRLSTIGDIYRCLAAHGMTRSDFLVALGGGVTGDMAGFAAATFLRGIGYVQVPTSLLSQIDSSVGGKTGVDLPEGKNLVGAFHQPRLVLIDPDTLATLPPRFFSDGMAEAIKYGCIKSRPLFELIRDFDLAADKGRLEQMIADCVDWKRRVVERDEFDNGERRLLNFGHTFGHALEKLYGFGKLSHGEAVGIGMVMAARAGEKNGLTKAGTAEEIADVLKKYHLPISDPAPLPELVKVTALDKKSTGGTLNLILLRETGDAFVHPVEKSNVEAFMRGDRHE